MKFGILLIAMIHIASAQMQLWYQQPTGNIGPAMSVLITTQGSIFASVHNKGIYRSLDSGKTWTQVAPFTDGVWSLTSSPTGELIAALWSKGIYRSINNGSSWTQVVTNKLHADIRAVNSVNQIFIEVEGLLYRSTNGGSTWAPSTIGANVIALQGDTMFAAKGTSVYRSSDNGKHWISHSTLPSSTYALTVEQSGKIFAGTYYSDTTISHSIFSYNTTVHTWNNNGPQSTINSLILRSDGVLFAASHDSGFYFSNDHGSTWKQYNNGLSTTKIYSLALLNDTTIVAGTLDGIFFNSGTFIFALPVELVSLTATVRNTTVELKWKTATETNNFGFTVERKTITNEQSTTNDWNALGFVESAGSNNAPKEYGYTDCPASSGQYQYRLKQIDRDGKFHFSQMIEVNILYHPNNFSLQQNFPNPFNPATIIRYDIAQEGNVALDLFDCLGKKIISLVNERKEPGNYSITLNANALPGGVYFYRLRSGNNFSTKKMVLLR